MTKKNILANAVEYHFICRKIEELNTKYHSYRTKNEYKQATEIQTEINKLNKRRKYLDEKRYTKIIGTNISVRINVYPVGNDKMSIYIQLYPDCIGLSTHSFVKLMQFYLKEIDPYLEKENGEYYYYY